MEKTKTKQDYWGLVKATAVRIGNQAIVEQAEANIEALNKEEKQKQLAN